MNQIRDVTESDLESILRLNDAEVQQTGPMDLEHLLALVQLSAYCKVTTVHNQVAAFLIAIRESAPYDSINYKWFASRYQSFLYVDRVVVAADFAGHGIGTMMYRDVFSFAHSKGVKMVASEYNIVPPNLVSRAFHDKFGFKELGRQWVADGTKYVTLQAAQVDEVSKE